MAACDEQKQVRKSAVRQDSLAQLSDRVILDVVMAIDFCVIVIGAVAAEWIYILSYLQNETSLVNYLVVGALGAFFTVVAMRRQGIYQMSALAQLQGQMNRILLGLAFAFMILVGLGYVLKISATFSRGWVAVWFGLSGLLILGHHFLVARVLRRWRSFGLFARSVAIYGSGEIAQKLVQHLGGNAENISIYGVYDDLPFGASAGAPASGGLSDLIRDGQTTKFDEILIALPLAEKGRILNIVRQLSVLPTNIRLCPDLVAFQMRAVGLVNYDGVALIELVRMPMVNWAPILKTIEDRVLATIALALLWPIFLLIALIIKLDSRGPVFFRQRRHGFNHQVISVVKFRTMSVSEDGRDVLQVQRHDPRVTRVGKFLRRTSLDELPQLLNVWRGEMSLVGPRPHALAHNEHYSALLETYASRHRMRPGITGWAQINGYRGETDTPEKMRKRVEFDLYYIENWSVWFDIKILLLTPFLGFFHKNAF